MFLFCYSTSYISYELAKLKRNNLWVSRTKRDSFKVPLLVEPYKTSSLQSSWLSPNLPPLAPQPTHPPFTPSHALSTSSAVTTEQTASKAPRLFPQVADVTEARGKNKPTSLTSLQLCHHKLSPCRTASREESSRKSNLPYTSKTSCPCIL